MKGVLINYLFWCFIIKTSISVYEYWRTQAI